MSVVTVHLYRARSVVTNTNTDENDPYGYLEFSLSATARFWLLLVFEIPSLACSLLLLFYLITDRPSRQSLHNHVIIALLIVGLFAQLIDVPFYLNFVRINYIIPPSPITCLLWWFAATAISNITNLLMAWGSIERHILVFHDRWLMTRRSRFLLHYMPLFTILIYGFGYYIIILLAYSCENVMAFDQDWCLYPCFYNDTQLAFYDTLVNSIAPTPIIVISCMSLLIRVLRKKRTLRQHIRWGKYRTMIIQLLLISALFLLFNLPMTSITLAYVCGVPLNSTGQFEHYTFFLYHYVSLLMPVVCFLSLADLRRKIRQYFKFNNLIHRIRQTTTT